MPSMDQVKLPKIKAYRPGFTLVELLVGMTLAVLMSGLLIGIVVNGIIAVDAAVLQLNRSSQSFTAVTASISTNMRQATAVPASEWGYSAPDLIIDVPKLKADQTTDPTRHDTLVYHFDAATNTLHEIVVPDLPAGLRVARDTVVASFVSGFRFTAGPNANGTNNDGAPVVAIAIDFTQTGTNGRVVTQTYRRSLVGRNG